MTVEEELKELIISRYKSLRQFSIEIEMPYSTIDTMLKRGVGKAGILNVIKICQALAIDTDALADGKIEERKVNDEAVTLREKSLLKKYRSIDMNGKETVDYVLNDIYDRCVKEQEEIYYPKKYIDKLPNIASAGIGDYLLDEIPIEKIEVDNDCQADFAIGIDGDSMSPTYDHNDVVLVKRQNTINVGEIGIFIVDGECFIKEYAKDRLISHNKDYPDKIFNECMDIRLVGKVIGKLNQ